MLIAASIICWFIAIALVPLAYRAFHKEKYALATMCVVLMGSFVLAGQSWFQGLLKTWVISNVGEKLAKLGTQIDAVQKTTGEMQGELATHQARLDSHQKEIDAAQGTLRTNQISLGVQQTSITNQYQAILTIQHKVADAQTNLEAQQKNIEDVAFLVKNLFGHTVEKVIYASDSDSVATIRFADGASQTILTLASLPIDHSIQIIAQTPEGQMPIVGVENLKNLVSIRFHPNMRVDSFIVRYVEDTRTTNLLHVAEIIDNSHVRTTIGVWRFLQNE